MISLQNQKKVQKEINTLRKNNNYKKVKFVNKVRKEQKRIEEMNS